MAADARASQEHELDSVRFGGQRVLHVERSPMHVCMCKFAEEIRAVTVAV